jgi:hypothetical protein
VLLKPAEAKERSDSYFGLSVLTETVLVKMEPTSGLEPLTSRVRNSSAKDEDHATRRGAVTGG